MQNENLENSTQKTTSTKTFDKFLMLLLASVHLWIHTGTWREQGLTDDDDFYIPASIRAWEWLQLFLTDPLIALNAEKIEWGFKFNREHPMFAKWVYGATHYVFFQKLHWVGEVDAARYGNLILSSGLIAVIFWIGNKLHSRLVGLTAALFFASLPRIYFHSEVGTLDMPVTALIASSAAIMFATLENPRRWKTMFAMLITGCAFGTKHNAPIAYLTIGLWLVGELFYFQKSTWTQRFKIYKDYILIGVGSFAVMILMWPWMWFDSLNRFGQYMGFHMKHYPILMFFDGGIYRQPYPPWYTPLNMATAVMPSLLTALGVVALMLVLWKNFVQRKQSINSITSKTTTHVDVIDGNTNVHVLREPPLNWGSESLLRLIAILTVTSIAAVMMPQIPKYGGEKLYMPFFVFFSILAAWGLHTQISTTKDTIGCLASILRRQIAYLLMLLIVWPCIQWTMNHPTGFALSYYSDSVGGLMGAVAKGYERTYYDVADKHLPRWLSEQMHGTKVFFAPNHKEYVRTYNWLWRDSWMPQNFQLIDDLENADVVVLTHERRWHSYPAVLKRMEIDERQNTERVYEQSIDGVPLYTVYKRKIHNAGK